MPTMKMTPAINVIVQNTLDDKSIPNDEQFELWANKSVVIEKNLCGDDQLDIQLTVRVVCSTEMQALNKYFRKQDKPTNVLAFPFEMPENAVMKQHLLGDVVICADVVKAEAIAQNKNLLAHWAHMVVHGLLHLLGYDHQNDIQAEQMETLETTILNKLGFENPYNE